MCLSRIIMQQVCGRSANILSVLFSIARWQGTVPIPLAAQTLLMDLFHRIRLVNSPENEVQYKQCWHSTLCLASARDTPYLGRYSMTACYDRFNEVIEPTVQRMMPYLKNHNSRLEQPRPHSKPTRNNSYPLGLSILEPNENDSQAWILLKREIPVLHTNIKKTLRTYYRVPPGEGSTLYTVTLSATKSSAHRRYLHEKTQT